MYPLLTPAYACLLCIDHCGFIFAFNRYQVTRGLLRLRARLWPLGQQRDTSAPLRAPLRRSR